MRNDDFDRQFQQTWNDIKQKQATYAKWAWVGGIVWLIGAVLVLSILALVVFILARYAGVI